MSNEEQKADVSADPHAHDPHIKVVKGQPSEEELAALIAVVAAASGAPSEPREAEQNLWGHPVDRLRYSTFSWQRVTLLERTHMRK
jgi:Acyl-CoA carboxylase epsilon subunit